MVTVSGEVDKDKVIAEKWDAFLRAAKKTKEAWNKLTESLDEHPIDNAKDLSNFAMRCINVFRKRTFEKMFSDFLIHVIHSGGFDNIK